MSFLKLYPDRLGYITKLESSVAVNYIDLLSLIFSKSPVQRLTELGLFTSFSSDYYISDKI